MTRTADEVIANLRYHHQLWTRSNNGRRSITIAQDPPLLGPICDTIVTKTINDVGCNYREFAVISDSCFTCPLSDCYFDNDETEVKEFIKTTVCVNGHPLKEFLRKRIRMGSKHAGKKGPNMFCAACDGEDPPIPPPPPPDPPIDTQLEFSLVT